jgi:hypothetical protein
MKTLCLSKESQTTARIRLLNGNFAGLAPRERSSTVASIMSRLSESEILDRYPAHCKTNPMARFEAGWNAPHFELLLGHLLHGGLQARNPGYNHNDEITYAYGLDLSDEQCSQVEGLLDSLDV